jgi:sec-independent protein translocase protein TatB
MLDMGWTEILLIGVVALIVVGPKDLPRMLRTLGQYTGKMRGMAREFQRSMDDAAREADLAEFKDINKSLQDVKAIGSDAARAVQQGIKNTEAEIERAAEAEEAVKPKPAPVADNTTGTESVPGDLTDDEPAPKASTAPTPTGEALRKTGTGDA